MSVPTALDAELERRAQAGDAKAQFLCGVHYDEYDDAARALLWLKRAAGQGFAAAKGRLAQRLLTRPPYDLGEGVKWAVEGAHDGDADAAHLASLLYAWGLGVTQDWQRSFNFLEIAARGGHTRDAMVLAGLAGDWRLVHDLERGATLDKQRYATLREAIRIDALLAFPSPRALSKAPPIAVIERFLPPHMCDWLITRARGNLAPAQVYAPSTGARAAEIRTNTELPIGTFDSDLIVMLLQHRIAAVTGLPLAGMEACTVLHYSPGEEFKPHHDAFDTTTSEDARIVSAEGQRVLTFLVYLNDEYSGGETEFPHLRIRFRGRKGDALFFWNITPDFAPDGRTLHAGLPPTSGEKWLFSQWIRARRP